MVMLMAMLSNEVAHRIVGNVILGSLESLEDTMINMLVTKPQMSHQVEAAILVHCPSFLQ